MNRYTRYYVNQSGGGGELGPVYRASFRVQRSNGIGSFFRGLFHLVKPLYSEAKAVGKEALKTGSNMITDMLNKEPEQPVGAIFKNRFIEAKDNLEQKN
jgi:protease II